MVQLDNHPLLVPLIAACVFEHLTDDIKSVCQSTKVCRLWFLEGYKHLWRHGQLGQLFFYVKDIGRRCHFASLLEELTFHSDDNSLASNQMKLQPLQSARLKSIAINQSNLIGVQPANIKSLIVPSLRFLSLESDGFEWAQQSKEDNDIFLDALISHCGTLTTLKFYPIYTDAERHLVSALIDSLQDIEHLELGYIAEHLHSRDHAEDFLYKVFTKSRLVYLSFPHGCDFTEHSVQLFLATMEPDWTLPSLRYLGRPVFFSSLAAASLLQRLPSLSTLHLTLEGHGGWRNSLTHTFAAISKLRQLEKLNLYVNVDDCDMDGSWLGQLSELESLESITLEFSNPGTVALTGAQLAAFLVGLPRLNYLELDFGRLEVFCSVEEKSAVDSAFARINELDTGDLIITAQPLV